MASELIGKVALVTGASRGLGRAIAELFAAEGAAVALVDVKAAWAQDAARSIHDGGGTAIGIGADVSSREQMHGAVATAVSAFGGVDVLVANAMWNRYDRLEDVMPETVDRMVGVGLSGVIWGIQAAAPAMRVRGGGSIITIGSMAGRLGMPGALVYCGVKAGVDGLTRSASIELGRDGIRVNAIAPSTIATEGVMSMMTAETLADREARSPLGRIGRTEDIAQTALWLASGRSNFVTGQSIAVDGGIGHAFAR